MAEEEVRLRFGALWWLIGALLIALLIYGSLATGGPILPVTIWDKLQHLGAYCVLAVYFSGLVEKRSYLLILLQLLALGLLMEWLQRQGGVRQFEWLDMVFNGAGLALGALLAQAGLRRWSRVAERFLA